MNLELIKPLPWNLEVRVTVQLRWNTLTPLHPATTAKILVTLKNNYCKPFKSIEISYHVILTCQIKLFAW